jgi:hypothetical protein
MPMITMPRHYDAVCEWQGESISPLKADLSHRHALCKEKSKSVPTSTPLSEELGAQNIWFARSKRVVECGIEVATPSA